MNAFTRCRVLRLVHGDSHYSNKTLLASSFKILSSTVIEYRTHDSVFSNRDFSTKFHVWMKLNIKDNFILHIMQTIKKNSSSGCKKVGLIVNCIYIHMLT